MAVLSFELFSLPAGTVIDSGVPRSSTLSERAKPLSIV
jgi:hypothetical protein